MGRLHSRSRLHNSKIHHVHLQEYDTASQRKAIRSDNSVPLVDIFPYITFPILGALILILSSFSLLRRRNQSLNLAERPIHEQNVCAQDILEHFYITLGVSSEGHSVDI